MTKRSHRNKFLCSNCLYSGKAGGSGYEAPRTCPSCQASDCCETVWYRLRFPSKGASKTRWKECIKAIHWDKRAKGEEGYTYSEFVDKVVKKVFGDG